MSVQFIGRVWAESKASGTARLVLLAIADHTNPSGIAWPSLNRIAAYSNVSRRAVIRAINQLVKLGELDKLGVGSGRHSTRYQIILGGVVSVTPEVSLESPLECHQRHPNHNRTIIEPKKNKQKKFGLFWNLYPKKVGKPAALKAYNAAIKKGHSHKQIMTGLESYNPVPPYICNPTTWLNQERYFDEQTTNDSSHGGAFKRAVVRRKANT